MTKKQKRDGAVALKANGDPYGTPTGNSSNVETDVIKCRLVPEVTHAAHVNGLVLETHTNPEHTAADLLVRFAQHGDDLGCEDAWLPVQVKACSGLNSANSWTFESVAPLKVKGGASAQEQMDARTLRSDKICSMMLVLIASDTREIKPVPAVGNKRKWMSTDDKERVWVLRGADAFEVMEESREKSRPAFEAAGGRVANNEGGKKGGTPNLRGKLTVCSGNETVYYDLRPNKRDEWKGRLTGNDGAWAFVVQQLYAAWKDGTLKRVRLRDAEQDVSTYNHTQEQKALQAFFDAKHGGAMGWLDDAAAARSKEFEDAHVHRALKDGALYEYPDAGGETDVVMHIPNVQGYRRYAVQFKTATVEAAPKPPTVGIHRHTRSGNVPYTKGANDLYVALSQPRMSEEGKVLGRDAFYVWTMTEAYVLRHFAQKQRVPVEEAVLKGSVPLPLEPTDATTVEGLLFEAYEWVDGIEGKGYTTGTLLRAWGDASVYP